MKWIVNWWRTNFQQSPLRPHSELNSKLQDTLEQIEVCALSLIPLFESNINEETFSSEW